MYPIGYSMMCILNPIKIHKFQNIFFMVNKIGVFYSPNAYCYIEFFFFSFPKSSIDWIVYIQSSLDKLLTIQYLKELYIR